MSKFERIHVTKQYVDEAIKENGFSGDYNDLTNKPYYDTGVSQQYETIGLLEGFSHENVPLIFGGYEVSFGYSEKFYNTYFGNIYPEVTDQVIESIKTEAEYYNYDEKLSVDEAFYGAPPYVLEHDKILRINFNNTNFIIVGTDSFRISEDAVLTRGIWAPLGYMDWDATEPDVSAATWVYTDTINEFTIRIPIYSEDTGVKCLDEKFIPDSVKDYNNLKNTPCLDSTEQVLEVRGLNDLLVKGVGDSILEEYEKFENLNISSYYTYYKINDEPLIDRGESFISLSRRGFRIDPETKLITSRTNSNLLEPSYFEENSNDHIDDSCYDLYNFMTIFDDFILVFEDDTPISFIDGATKTLSRGTYAKIGVQSVTDKNDINVAACIIVLTNKGEFRELDSKFIQTELDNIYKSKPGEVEGGLYDKVKGEIFNISVPNNNMNATGVASHAEGFYTTALGYAQHVQGTYNIRDYNEEFAHIVGNGTHYSLLSNAHTLDWKGNAWFAGGVKSDKTDHFESNDLVTKQYVDSKVNGNNIILKDIVTGFEFKLYIEDGEIKQEPLDKVELVLEKTEFMEGEPIKPAANMKMKSINIDGEETLSAIENPDEVIIMGENTVSLEDTEVQVMFREQIYTFPITVTKFDPATVLIDFTYLDNRDGTYLLRAWKRTYNGVSSSSLIIPDNSCVVLDPDLLYFK